MLVLCPSVCLLYICITEKPPKEANRKGPMGNRMVTWPAVSGYEYWPWYSWSSTSESWQQRFYY